MTQDLSQMNGVTLAYIGDAVIELLIREALVALGVRNTGTFSAIAQKLVCAPMQSELVEILMPLLTEDEAAAFRLGRNYHTKSKPKHATPAQYNRATGMEAVFGYLQLTKKADRSNSLLSQLYDNKIAQFRDIY